MTYFFSYFQEAIMMNVCSCLEKLFFSVTKGAAAAGRIVCLILGQPKPIGNYNTMGRSLEQKPIHHKVQERWRGHGTHTHISSRRRGQEYCGFNSTVSKIFFARINIEIGFNLSTYSCCCYSLVLPQCVILNKKCAKLIGNFSLQSSDFRLFKLCYFFDQF